MDTGLLSAERTPRLRVESSAATPRGTTARRPATAASCDSGCGNWRRHAPRFGYERLHILLTREGWRVGRNRVHRLYKLEGLQVRMRVRRRKRISLAPRARSHRHGRRSVLGHGFRS